MKRFSLRTLFILTSAVCVLAALVRSDATIAVAIAAIFLMAIFYDG